MDTGGAMSLPPPDPVLIEFPVDPERVFRALASYGDVPYAINTEHHDISRDRGYHFEFVCGYGVDPEKLRITAPAPEGGEGD